MNIHKTIQSALDHYHSGNLKQAEELIRKVLKKQPDNADAYYHLANTFHKAGKLDEAISFYQKAVEISPNFTSAFYNLGVTYQDKEDIDRAIYCYQKTIEMNPRHAMAHYNLGVAFHKKNDIDKAIFFYKKAVGLDKGLFRAYLNLGIALKETGQPDEAILYCKEAIRINPDYAEAHYNLGNAYAAKGKLDEAKQSYQKTIDINTEHVLAHWNIALIHLTLGNFKDGWKGYELRWKLENNEDKRSFPQPLWDGSSLTDRTLFIYTEQGVGDEIMFASCLSEVITQTELCLVECDKRLVPVFERSFPKAKVIEKIGATNPYPPELPPFDLVVPIGSLPLYLRPDLSSFHKFIAYLVPDVSKVEFWHNRFKELGAGLKIGISWRGGSNPYDRLKRSIDLAQWKELFSITGIFFINLQYGDCNYELREAKENMGVTIYDWEDSDPLKDLDGFAAQISALDLVVSVDSATVHMAGALGKPVWTLLPFVSDWRWMLDREDTPWYPTMRLFRQPSPRDWKSVIDRVEKELKALVSARFYGSARAALYAVEESSDDKNSE